MIKTLHVFFSKRLLDKTEDPAESEKQLQLAAAALMFELVRSDGKIEQQELLAMSEILRGQFELSTDELDNLLRLAKQSVAQATDLHTFTKEIRDKWSNAERMKLVENLWLIALADKTIDAHERHLVRKVAGLLYLTEIQIMQAREHARRRLQIEFE